MMDTKTLHDACRDAGINMRDEDSGDAHHIAMELVFRDEDFRELHVEWLADALLARNPSTSEKHDRDRWSGTMVTAYSEHDMLSTPRMTDRLVDTYACSFAYSMGAIGRIVFDAVREAAEKYVDKHIDEWWADVQSYAGDMEAGAEEDWAYEQWRDRQMERDS